MNPEEPFVADKFLSEHHLCHFGIRLVGTHPSGVVYQLLTTEEVPSHHCAHPGEQHAFDRELLTGEIGVESLRRKAEVEFCKKLLQEWIHKQDLFACFGADGMVGSATLSGRYPTLNSIGDYPARKPDSHSYSNLETLPSTDNRDYQTHHRHQKVDESLPHLTTTKIVEQSCADPIPNFPTDSAAKAKVRLKQVKEQGKLRKGRRGLSKITTTILATTSPD